MEKIKTDNLAHLPLFNELPRLGASLLENEEKKPVAAIIIDIDGLIWLNDSFGFEDGDAAIAKLGKWLGKMADINGGKAFRIRGEEFLLLISSYENETITDFAEYLVNESKKLAIPYSRNGIQ